jgi:hypothetical protein
MFGMDDLADQTYNTAEEARAVADQLGLDSVHEVRKNGMLMFRPGDDEEELRAALRDRGPMDGLMGGSGGSSGPLGFPDDEDDENDTGPFGFL